MPADTIDKSNLKKLITFTVDMICEKKLSVRKGRAYEWLLELARCDNITDRHLSEIKGYIGGLWAMEALGLSDIKAFTAKMDELGLPYDKARFNYADIIQTGEQPPDKQDGSYQEYLQNMMRVGRKHST